MTCFWSGIMESLSPSERDIIGLKRPVYYEFIALLKKFNTKPNIVKWNGNKFSVKQLEECVEHVKCYDIETARNGYFCSTCDPFLALLSQLLEIRIIHIYLGQKMIYEPDLPKIRGEKIFSSDRGHFRFRNKKDYS